MGQNKQKADETSACVSRGIVEIRSYTVKQTLALIIEIRSLL